MTDKPKPPDRIYCERDPHLLNAGTWQEVEPLSSRPATHLLATPEREAAGELRLMVRSLSQAEHDYRVVHDSNEPGHINTGRAWDRLRKTGDRARAMLARIEKEEADAEVS